MRAREKVTFRASYRIIPVISPGLIQLRKGFIFAWQAKNILTKKCCFSQCSVASFE